MPRLADGKPDLSGLYIAERNLRLVGSVTLVPGAESFRVVERRERDVGTGADCLPPGVPAATMLPFPLQIVHTPDMLAILYEAYHQFRIAPVGREHAEYLAPAWMGHSVAHWDGDTLVVDVRGFNDRTVIAGHRPHRGSARHRSATAARRTRRSSTKRSSRIRTCSPRRCATPAR